MKRAARIAALAASALVIVGAGVASFFVNQPAAVAPTMPEAETVETVTLILHGKSDPGELVVFSCPNKAGEMAECQEPVPAGGLWSKEVDVPEGMAAYVRVSEGFLPPWCSIMDETDTVERARNHATGKCEWVAKK
jgi:hypothetical protein